VHRVAWSGLGLDLYPTLPLRTLRTSRHAVLHRSDPPVQSATNAIPDTEMEASSSSFGVVISNLSSQATEEDIKESFSFCGAFRSLTLRPCVDHRATAAEPASC
jgi:hypothetical protein